MIGFSSLSNILDIATSGLQAAQTGLGAVSNNVANVNTPGYSREIVNQSASFAGGYATGVSVDSITRATNQWLEAANYSAQSQNGAASILNQMLDQAQSLFGDPSSSDSSSSSSSSSTSFFDQLDSVFSSFSTLENNPSSAGQSAAITQLQTFLSQGQSVVSNLQTMVGQADQNIQADVSNANSLLQQIGQLNTQISQATSTGGDATGAENQQAGLISQLSGLMNINVSANSTGGVNISAGDGTPLVTNQNAASLSYSPGATSGQLMFTPVGGGSPQPMSSRLSSGELSGLLDLRNNQLPNIISQVSNLMGATASALNTVSNQFSAQPAPTTLTGRNTGMDLATDISGFTGTTNVAVLDSSGNVQTQVAIDFSAGTMSVNGGAPVSFTPASFLTTLNSQLGTSGSASFSNGALSISANGGGGVVVSDDSTTPSSKAGQGFSDFFGLNDLVQSSANTDYDTGLTSTSQSGYPPGQTITFALTAPDGTLLKNVTVTTPAGGTMQDLLNSLNDRSTGVGLYGSFSLDQNGELSFTPNGGSGVNLSVQNDTTANSATGMSMSELFGIGAATRVSAQGTLAVNPTIASDPTKLQSATVDLSGGVGSQALSQTDNSAYAAFANANSVSTSFDAAGGIAAQSGTLSDYASTISQAIATQASNAETTANTASSVMSEAQSRLSSTEGVNMDQELISLTTYQQAYSASARLLQATQDMFTTLISMTGT